MKKSLLVITIAALFLIPACGSANNDSEKDVDSPTKVAKPNEIELGKRFTVKNPLITIRIISGQQNWFMQCNPEPVNGDWPLVKSQCSKLNRNLFAPITTQANEQVAITKIPLTIKGKAYGKEFNFSFQKRGTIAEKRKFDQFNRALGLDRVLPQL